MFDWVLWLGLDLFSVLESIILVLKVWEPKSNHIGLMSQRSGSVPDHTLFLIKIIIILNESYIF